MRGFWFKFRHTSTFQQRWSWNLTLLSQELGRGEGVDNTVTRQMTHTAGLCRNIWVDRGSYWPIESTQQCLPESLKKRTSEYSETQFLDFCFHRGAYKGVHFRSTAAKCCEANHFLSQTFFPLSLFIFLRSFDYSKIPFCKYSTLLTHFTETHHWSTLWAV